MFRHLIPFLADRFHVIAPDLPGFRQLPAPDRERFANTFQHYADLMGALLDQLDVVEYAFYSFDYGAPIGYRSTQDLPNAEYHELDTGHFLPEDQFDVAAPLIHEFLDRKLGER